MILLLILDRPLLTLPVRPVLGPTGPATPPTPVFPVLRYAR
jgi:hypothetical protein